MILKIIGDIMELLDEIIKKINKLDYLFNNPKTIEIVEINKLEKEISDLMTELMATNDDENLCDKYCNKSLESYTDDIDVFYSLSELKADIRALLRNGDV